MTPLTKLSPEADSSTVLLPEEGAPANHKPKRARAKKKDQDKDRPEVTSGIRSSEAYQVG